MADLDPEAPSAKRRRTRKGPDAQAQQEELPAASSSSSSSRPARATPGRQRCRRPSSGSLLAGTQENSTEDQEEGQSENPKNELGALGVIARIIEHHKCPITQQLLVDPVVAEDGHVYEKRALEMWLLTKKTSPTTNKPMGSAVVSALAARQTVSDLAEQGMLDKDTSLQFFSDRGQLRATRMMVPGPDLEGARKDFQQALALARSASQRRIAEFQLEAVAWMQRGAGLFAQAQRIQSSQQDLGPWMLDLGDAARAAVTWPLLESRRMGEWQALKRGARVKVLDDAGELQELCERPPQDAESKVGWNAEMIGFAGKVCTVQRIGDASHKNYILRRVAPPAGRDFSFPYDTLYLLEDS